jgi:hypothetical protein
MKENVMDILYYLILAAMVVLIIMNAPNFATAVGAVEGQVNSTLKTISGSGYGKAS